MRSLAWVVCSYGFRKVEPAAFLLLQEIFSIVNRVNAEWIHWNTDVSNSNQRDTESHSKYDDVVVVVVDNRRPQRHGLHWVHKAKRGIMTKGIYTIFHADVRLSLYHVGHTTLLHIRCHRWRYTINIYSSFGGFYEVIIIIIRRFSVKKEEKEEQKRAR